MASGQSIDQDGFVCYTIPHCGKIPETHYSGRCIEYSPKSIVWGPADSNETHTHTHILEYPNGSPK